VPGIVENADYQRGARGVSEVRSSYNQDDLTGMCIVLDTNQLVAALLRPPELATLIVA
jgi:hypothetical protein